MPAKWKKIQHPGVERKEEEGEAVRLLVCSLEESVSKSRRADCTPSNVDFLLKSRRQERHVTASAASACFSILTLNMVSL